MENHRNRAESTINGFLCVLLILILNGVSGVSEAQVVPSQVNSTIGLQISVPVIESFPPLSMGMPLDVLLGYIYYDSLSRTMPRLSIDSFARGLTNSDTLAYAIKYLYEMDDYDPITFRQWLKLTPSIGHYKTSPGYIYSKFAAVASTIIPDTERTAMLCGSDFIAHVRISSLQDYDDSARSDLQNEVIVSCQVLDTIKGNVYPPCPETSTLPVRSPGLLSVGECLQLVYSPSSPRSAAGGDVLYGWMPRLQDSSGNPWIALGQEYIAFLSIISLGNDSSNYVLTICPVYFKSSFSGLYPIVSGVVQDPNNDFGFGANLPVSDFITALRSRIYSIKNP